jgi:hypothetical protein
MPIPFHKTGTTSYARLRFVDLRGVIGRVVLALPPTLSLSIAILISPCLASQSSDVSALIQQLSRDSPVTRGNACRSLARKGDEASPAIPALVAILGDARKSESAFQRYFRKLYSYVAPLASSRDSSVTSVKVV